jgi:predicted RNA binding protein YcfA (HicA-like mRNA interferase family)
MSKWNPCKRRDFIRKLKRLGFEGPYPGTRHQLMRYGSRRLTIPSNSEFSVPQLRMLIRQVENVIGREITPGEWSGL